MGYKIRRFSIIEKESIFSDRQDDLKRINQAEEICYEIIKIMEMYDNSPRDFNHWVKKAASALSMKKTNMFSNSLPLARVVEKLSLLEASDDIKEKIFDNYGVDFIKSVRKSITDQSRYKNNTRIQVHDDLFYVRFFSFLSLILEGKEQLENVDTETIYKTKPIRIKVSTSGPKVSDEREILKIISEYIIAVKGYDNGNLF